MEAGGLAVLLTGVGKRYDIVSAFARHAFVVAADPNPLAPAQYAADVRVAPPAMDDPDYVQFLERVAREHDVRAVVPLTDLDIEILARSGLPAFVPEPDVAGATFDKYEAHELLLRHGLPSPPTVLPGEDPGGYPVVVKPRRGSGARSIHRAADREQMEFFIGYADEPVMPGFTSRRRRWRGVYWSTCAFSVGRGPTSAMSPLSTFTRFGSSSIENRRSSAPTRVIRGSPSFTASPAPMCSAPDTIVRSLSSSKVRPSLPTRSWR